MIENGKSSLRLGFVGQGWIGRHLADHFETRGFEVFRYALEPQYRDNKGKIVECDIVFIAVPTPTTTLGFNYDAVKDALSLIGKGKTAVIRSTLLPGTTDGLATEFPDRYIFHMPEFLREATVEFDIANPVRNAIGIPQSWREEDAWIEQAEVVLSIMPKSSQVVTDNLICTAVEAEFIKHVSNELLCAKTVFMNVMYDAFTTVGGGSWDVIVKTLVNDPRIGTSHMNPVHQHDHMEGPPARGAGGHCFPKDWTAFRKFFGHIRPEDKTGRDFWRAIEAKNLELLLSSGKDTDILRAIYGDNLEAAANLN